MRKGQVKNIAQEFLNIFQVEPKFAQEFLSSFLMNSQDHQSLKQCSYNHKCLMLEIETNEAPFRASITSSYA